MVGYGLQSSRPFPTTLMVGCSYIYIYVSICINIRTYICLEEFLLKLGVKCQDSFKCRHMSPTDDASVSPRSSVALSAQLHTKLQSPSKKYPFNQVISHLF